MTLIVKQVPLHSLMSVKKVAVTALTLVLFDRRVKFLSCFLTITFCKLQDHKRWAELSKSLKKKERFWQWLLTFQHVSWVLIMKSTFLRQQIQENKCTERIIQIQMSVWVCFIEVTGERNRSTRSAPRMLLLLTTHLFVWEELRQVDAP